MKTNVAETSLDAYDILVQSGKLQELEAKILRAMEPGKLYSNRYLSELTGLETGNVSGRVNRLVHDLKMLEVVGKRPCPSNGHNVQAVKLPVRQMELC